MRRRIVHVVRSLTDIANLDLWPNDEVMFQGDGGFFCNIGRMTALGFVKEGN